MIKWGGGRKEPYLWAWKLGWVNQKIKEELKQGRHVDCIMSGHEKWEGGKRAYLLAQKEGVPIKKITKVEQGWPEKVAN